jgi:hypothetical protein
VVPIITKSTTGVRPVGRAEKATTAKLGTFEPKASGTIRGRHSSKEGPEATTRKGHI